jgi:hypothetical protein
MNIQSRFLRKIFSNDEKIDLVCGCARRKTKALNHLDNSSISIYNLPALTYLLIFFHPCENKKAKKEKTDDNSAVNHQMSI